MKKQSVSLLNSPDSSEYSFYWIVTLILLVVAAYVFITIPQMRAPVRMVPFSALLLVHIVLHWLAPSIFSRNHTLLASGYLMLQGALAFTLTLMLDYGASDIGAAIAVCYGTFLGCVGEAIGALRKNIWRIGFTAFYLLLSLLAWLLVFGANQWLYWMIGMLPTTIFIAIYVLLYNRQTEARQKTQKLLHDLEIAHQQLAESARQIEALTLANERQRMARELHDTLAQGLAGIILQLEAIDSHLLQGNSAKSQQILQHTMKKARATLAESRQVIDDLRGTAHEARHLDETLQACVDEFAVLAHIPCELSTINLSPALDELLQQTVLRIVREALGNINKHARASKATVQVEQTAASLFIVITDDGKGFDSQQPVPEGHYGVKGMQERVEEYSGTLEIISKPGNGTTLRVSLPLKDH